MFWFAASQLSGRIDFSGLLAAGVDPSTASDAVLVHHGVARRVLGPLRQQSLGGGPVLPEGVRALPLTSADYPAPLRPLPYAPPVLFVSGRVELLSQPCAAIVGARRCSVPARRFAAQLAEAVSDAGGVVVSGLAWGIDDAAHQGAGSRTVAVLAQGLGVPFSGDLARRAKRLVQAGGVLVSEFVPGLRPDRWTFRQRNRVISGLSRVTAIVEASERSGSLITARSALEQGRELFVVPDHPSARYAAGGLALLETGVAPLLSPRPLIEALGLRGSSGGSRSVLHELLSDHPTPAILADRTGESLRTWVRRLAAWELSGCVERLPGGRFCAGALPPPSHPPG